MTIRLTLAIGIGVAAMLAIVKIITEANILLFIGPLYAIALILMIFTPRLFVGLAFDSGGVARRSPNISPINPINPRNSPSRSHRSRPIRPISPNKRLRNNSLHIRNPTHSSADIRDNSR